MDEPNKLIRESDGDAAQLRARIQELETKLQREKIDSVGRLAGGLAHEINNLLTPVLAYGSMLSEELPPGSPLREYAAEISKAGDRIAAMAKTLQSLRIKPGSMYPIAAGEVVRATLDRLAPGLGPDIVLDAHLAQGLNVAFESGQLERMLEAFLRNARQAMPAGGRVVVTVEPVADAAAARLPEGAWARIAVRDEGSGMAPDVRGQMFEPYFFTGPKKTGKGVGLASVYAAVCRAGGHLRVESELGAGTEIQVFLRQANGMSDTVS